MNRLLPLALLPMALVLSSCGLAQKVIQPPVRLLQAGVRTLSVVQNPISQSAARALAITVASHRPRAE